MAYRSRAAKFSRAAVAFLITFSLPAYPSTDRSISADFFDLSIEELLRIHVTSVSKREDSLSDAAASIYVIRRADIKNAGARTIPEALSLAPQLQVARITGSQYAISARGFNSAASNKLLVLLDGRTLYSPLFSGVFWDQQDVMLEDVDRIEVISGPGGTLWGSNAVNGIINIVTRRAEETGGWVLAGHAGELDRGLSTRYGGTIGDSGHFRVYGKLKDIGNSVRFDNANPHDAFRSTQAGFRGDWKAGNDSFTLQGDSYRGETEDRGFARNGTALGNVRVNGTNLLARWQRSLDQGASFQLQAYWDYTKRRDVVLFQPRADIFDIEAQYSLPVGDHLVLLGGGYRYGRDDVDPGFFSTFVPDSRTLEWENLFIQDQFDLAERLKATLGIKLENNSYTGLEYLPTARLAWSHSEHAVLWAAISRAVRAPSRYDRDVYFPAPPNSIIAGGPDFESEVADVYEIGYRGQVSDRLAYSATLYYHDWDKLRSGTTSVPMQIRNDIEGEVYGVEAWATYQVTPHWRLSAGGARLEQDLRAKPGSNATGVNNDILSNDPEYHAQLRSNWRVSERSSLEVSLQRVGALPHPRIPAYHVINAHYAWQAHDGLEISLTGQNLANRRHQEFGRPVSINEFERRVWLGLLWAH
jgi:iron complex outermembrane receptor protein